MPLKSKDYTVSVGLRISAEQAEKLDSLAALKGLQRNALLRHLIERVVPSAFPSISVDKGQTQRTEELLPVTRGADEEA